MSSNLLELPAKRTTAINLEPVLSDLILNQFAQHVQDFSDDISRFAALRDAIATGGSGTIQLSNLQEYYTQLCYITSKFPIDIGVEFEWFSASNDGIRYSLDDLTYERANVLYNIAMAYSALGTKENRSTAEGLKKSHQQFQNAAGCLTSLGDFLDETTFLKPEDLQPEYLTCLKSIMLAQAQECIWQRAVLDQMKDKLIAQLSEQVSRYYGQAAESLEKSTAMSTAWIHHLRLKQYHFAAAAQVRMSSFAMSSNKYGEEVARLRLATDLCSKAQQHASYVSKTVAQDLRGLIDHVNSISSRAEKDNDMIYVEAVPSAGSLTSISPQIMVKPSVLPQISEPLSAISKDKLLFSKLIPFVVRNVMDIYEQRKQELITKEIVNKLHALDLEMQALLQELGLPGSLTVVEQPLGLPQSLLTYSAEVRQRGGVKYLQGLLDEVATLAAANSELVDQIVDVMDEATMDADDTEAEAALEGFRKQVDSYQTFLTQAQTSDKLVQTKLEQWTKQIDLLASDESTLGRAIPNAKRATLSRDGESAARRIRTVLDSWERITQDRKSQIEEARHYAATDDISPTLIAQGSESQSASDYEPILTERLHFYTPLMDRVTASGKSQTRLMSDLRAAHKSFHDAVPTSTSTERERVVQDLEGGYIKYREIIHNLEEGSKFYTDFHKALCRVSDEVGAAVKNIKEETLIRKTQRVSLNTVVSPGRVAPGTWDPRQGIAFAGTKGVEPSASDNATQETPKRVTRSAVRETGHVFDPSRHAIKFAPSK